VVTADLLSSLRERGVRVWLDEGRLKCDAPAGVLDDGLRAELAAHRDDLIELVRQADAELQAPRSLVPLKPSGGAPPLFARPGHNGDVFCYRRLSEHFDEHRPLYGVEPKGVDGTEIPATVEQIAAYEVAQIRAFQPAGPYLLAGFCAGGSVAFEAARQLDEAGADVERVFLIGSPFPLSYRTGNMRLQVRSMRQRTAMHTSRIAAGSLSEGVTYVGGRVGARLANARSRPDPTTMENRRRLERATMAAVKTYHPPFFPGRVDLVMPTEAWRHSGDRSDDWKLVAAEVVEHIGPDDCDGDLMLLDPYVEPIAALLNSALPAERKNDGTD
jgi:thioesterase domain-containing protein